ncbi:hypothetical protein ACSTLL_08980 [Vibrio parahaemolyticus]
MNKKILLPLMLGISATAAASDNKVVESVLIDNIALEGYVKKSYEVVMQSEPELFPYEFRGSRVQMKLLVELFHNSKNDKKAARVITLGNGYVPGKPGVKHTFDAAIVDRFTQNYPVAFDYSIIKLVARLYLVRITHRKTKPMMFRYRQPRLHRLSA